MLHNPCLMRKIKKINYTIIFSVSCILFITLLIYLSAFNNGFTNFDDHRYILENSGIKHFSFKNIYNYFFTFFDGHYHPLTMLSLSIDYLLGGLNPGQYHFTNILIHLLNTSFVFWFIYKLFKNIKISTITALLFGISTMGVESVAWISERKNLLYTFFYLASLINYIKYTEYKKNRFFFFSFLLFLLSVLSKSQAITLCLTLPAIDFLLKRNFLSKQVIIEKIPFFITAIIFGFIARLAQQSFWINLSETGYSFFERIIFAGHAFIQYIIKLIVPVNLSAFYPYPVKAGEIIPFQYYLYIIPVIAIIIVLVFTFRRSRPIAFGILFFIINIFFVLKIFNIPYGNYFMADRYIYLSSVGIFMIAGIGCNNLLKRGKITKIITCIIFTAYIIFLGLLTYQQNKTWKNSITLWSNVIERFPEATMAWNDRGNAKANSGDLSGAISDFNHAIKADPRNSVSYNNRGNAKGKSGDYQEAVNDFNKAIELNPDYADAFNNRGLANTNLGYFNLAISDFNTAIKIKPEFVIAINNRGNAYRKSGNPDKAITDFNKAISLNPDFAQAYANRGNTKCDLGKFESSINDFNASLKLGLKHHTIYFKRGFAKYNLKDFKGAIQDFDKSIKIKKNYPDSYTYRGFGNYNLGNYFKAIDDLNISIRMSPDFALSYAIRGLAKIKTGQNNQGCVDLQKAAELGLEAALKEMERYCRKNH